MEHQPASKDDLARMVGQPVRVNVEDQNWAAQCYYGILKEAPNLADGAPYQLGGQAPDYAEFDLEKACEDAGEKFFSRWDAHDIITELNKKTPQPRLYHYGMGGGFTASLMSPQKYRVLLQEIRERAAKDPKMFKTTVNNIHSIHVNVVDRLEPAVKNLCEMWGPWDLIQHAPYEAKSKYFSLTQAILGNLKDKPYLTAQKTVIAIAEAAAGRCLTSKFLRDNKIARLVDESFYYRLATSQMPELTNYFSHVCYNWIRLDRVELLKDILED